MKVNAKVTYLGIESGKNKDGKDYHIVGLLQGFDTQRIYVGEEIKNICKNLTPMTSVNCELDIRQAGERCYFNLLHIYADKEQKNG